MQAITKLYNKLFNGMTGPDAFVFYALGVLSGLLFGAEVWLIEEFSYGFVFVVALILLGGVFATSPDTEKLEMRNSLEQSLKLAKDFSTLNNRLLALCDAHETMHKDTKNALNTWRDRALTYEKTLRDIGPDSLDASERIKRVVKAALYDKPRTTH